MRPASIAHCGAGFGINGAVGTFGNLRTAEMVKEKLESRFEVDSFTASGDALAGAASLARIKRINEVQ